MRQPCVSSCGRTAVGRHTIERSLLVLGTATNMTPAVAPPPRYYNALLFRFHFWPMLWAFLSSLALWRTKTAVETFINRECIASPFLGLQLILLPFSLLLAQVSVVACAGCPCPKCPTHCLTLHCCHHWSGSRCDTVGDLGPSSATACG